LTELTFQVAIRTPATTVHCQLRDLSDALPRTAKGLMPSHRRLRAASSFPRTSSYELPGAAAALAVGLTLVSDALLPESGEPVWLAGPLDEIAHLANGVVVLGAFGTGVDRRLARGLIGASVLIDIDHVPQYAGARWLTAGTARPYPHSLLTLIASLTAFLALRRNGADAGASRTSLGVLIGLGAHFVRDLAVPGIGMPLLWPINNRAFTIPHGLYVASLAAGLGRCLVRRVGRRHRA
jgi:membrane-bound metal-dependent hydrolase YbcI (DUF457 family)